jgi:molybdate transport system substrate-binding protein
MRSFALAVTLALMILPARAGSTHVAVAANFTEAATGVAAAFKAATGHEAVLSFGASGALYAQITQGAPYEILLSADQEWPGKAVAAGLALDGTRFTYALGRLVLWSRDGRATRGDDALRAGDFRKLAIANPVAAPYGGAAVETLQALQLYDALAPKIVQGASIAQTFQFAETGNAELAFVALSQVINRTEGGRWLVPQSLYKPILQDAVLLKTGETNEAARAFMAFLKGPVARSLIARQGYETQGAR